MTEVRMIWKSSGPGIRLILINCLIYIFWLLLNAVFHLMNKADSLGTWVELFQLPGSLLVLLTQPWSILSHMFLHQSFWHLAFNMLTLYFSIQLFVRYFSEKYITAIYIYSGLAGALVFLLSVNVFPLFTENGTQYHALGASAAAMGVLMSVCFFRPGDEVMLFGIVRLKLGILALLFILADLAQIQGSGNAAGHLAHLGGALYGYLWSLYIKEGKNIAIIPAFIRKKRQKSPLRKVQGHRISIQDADEQYNLSKKEKQERIDQILDKISRSGYDSLNKEEKRILFEASKGQ